MKTIYFILFFIGLNSLLNAQDLIVHKDGLVLVDDSAQFYLIKINKSILGVNNYSFQNLYHQELAKLTFGENNDNTSNSINIVYTILFTESQDKAEIDDYNILNTQKSLATILYNADLIKNNFIDYNIEKKFIIKHNGMLNLNYTPDITLHQIALNQLNENVNNVDTVTIPEPLSNGLVLQDNFVFLDKKLICNYTLKSDSLKNIIVEINNNQIIKIIVASLKQNTDFWEVTLLNKNQKLNYPKNKEKPLQGLFEDLIKNKEI